MAYSMLPVDYDALFRRAATEETLLVMVKGACRDRKISYDEYVNSYAAARKVCSKFGNHTGVRLFKAAEKHLKRIQKQASQTAFDRQMVAAFN